MRRDRRLSHAGFPRSVDSLGIAVVNRLTLERYEAESEPSYRMTEQQHKRWNIRNDPAAPSQSTTNETYLAPRRGI